MAIQEQLIPANRSMARLFNAAVAIMSVADANILSLTTWAGTSTTTSMEGMIRNLTVPERNIRLREQIADQLAKVALLGLSTDTAIAAADDLTGVRAIWNTNDSNVGTGALYNSFAWAV
jgi:hypothetical protein